MIARAADDKPETADAELADLRLAALEPAPQAGRSWQGSRRYNHSHGLSLEYGWRPTPDWQLIGAWLWLKRSYDDRAYAAYDGRLDVLSLTAIRIFSPALMIYGSVGLQLWTPDLKIVGLEPKLNLSYLKITGNLPMYARDRTEVGLMLEKRF